MDFRQTIVSRLDRIEDEVTRNADVELHILREDEIHPFVSGNKFRKLKYNVLKVEEERLKGIITYGGAHSNHIAATAVACNLVGLPCKGIIRKGFSGLTDTPTLELAKANGMELEFLDNESFKTQKLHTGITQENWLEIPEGGANKEGVIGCEEIMEVISEETEIVATACGTGSTLAGMLNSKKAESKSFVGVNVLKAPGYITKEVQCWSNNPRFTIFEDYHFGGYAKASEQLFTFINWFYKKHGIKLDSVYTGKLLFALYDQMKQGLLTHKSVVAIHTGGLQGNTAMEKRYNIKLFT